jgi:hypothetical protein
MDCAMITSIFVQEYKYITEIENGHSKDGRITLKLMPQE